LIDKSVSDHELLSHMFTRFSALPS